MTETGLILGPEWNLLVDAEGSLPMPRVPLETIESDHATSTLASSGVAKDFLRYRCSKPSEKEVTTVFNCLDLTHLSQQNTTGFAGCHPSTGYGHQRHQWKQRDGELKTAEPGCSRSRQGTPS